MFNLDVIAQENGFPLRVDQIIFHYFHSRHIVVRRNEGERAL